MVITTTVYIQYVIIIQDDFFKVILFPMVVSDTKHSRNPIFCLGLCTIRLSLGYKSTNQITPYHRDARGEIVAQIF